MLLKTFSQIDKIVYMCWYCKTDEEIQDNVSRSAECPVCHRDLHSCKNCVFYSPGSHNDCRETNSEFISDKEKSNFCDYFKLNKNFSNQQKQDQKAQDARKLFDSLFSN